MPIGSDNRPQPAELIGGSGRPHPLNLTDIKDGGQLPEARSVKAQPTY